MRAIEHFPLWLRPSLFVCGVVGVTCLVILRGRQIWRAACRGFADFAELGIGLVLLPEYALTSYRRRQGSSPGQGTMVLGLVADRCLHVAASMHERHAVGKTRKRSFPWMLLLALLLVSPVGWFIRERAPMSKASSVVASGFVQWQRVETWAERGEPPPVKR